MCTLSLFACFLRLSVGGVFLSFFVFATCWTQRPEKNHPKSEIVLSQTSTSRLLNDRGSLFIVFFLYSLIYGLIPVPNNSMPARPADCFVSLSHNTDSALLVARRHAGPSGVRVCCGHSSHRLLPNSQAMRIGGRANSGQDAKRPGHSEKCQRPLREQRGVEGFPNRAEGRVREHPYTGRAVRDARENERTREFDMATPQPQPSGADTGELSNKRRPAAI